MAFLAISQFMAAAQKPTAPAHSAAATSKPAGGQLPKIWHSDATKHDFRVEVTNDLFRAEWVNVPPAVAKQGSYIRTECRKAGSKWVGSSRGVISCDHMQLLRSNLIQNNIQSVQQVNSFRHRKMGFFEVIVFNIDIIIAGTGKISLA